MNQPSLKYIWGFFDKIYILGKCYNPHLFAHFDIPYTATNRSIENISSYSLKKGYKYILVLKSNTVPTLNITYFSLLRLKRFITNYPKEWDMISIATKPSIMYDSNEYVNRYIYQHSSCESFGYIINRHGMNKFSTFETKKVVLHHSPYLFKVNDHYEWIMNLKEWYGFHINIPLVYLPFIVVMLFLKYYSRKIFNRIRRATSPNITLLIQNNSSEGIPLGMETTDERPILQRSQSY